MWSAVRRGEHATLELLATFLARLRFHTHNAVLQYIFDHRNGSQLQRWLISRFVGCVHVPSHVAKL